jgi:N-acetylglucosaminyl-diphospho-decaprenol L-rhamnosyltransferase
MTSASDPSHATLLVAIVNFRTARLAIECMRSLEPELKGLSAQVVVADNDSGDDSVSLLKNAIETEGWQNWASVLEVPLNRGFAAGNNAIIGPALRGPSPPDFVLLLNPDTTVLPGALGELLTFMESHKRVGIVGASQRHPTGAPLRSAFRFVNPLGEFDGSLRLGPISNVLRRWEHAPPIPEKPTETDWVSGGCMMIRREVFEQAGLMDDGYFLYFEEMDYCLQAKRAGWSTWFLPSAHIVHIGGQSTGVSGIHRIQQRKPRYWFDSRRRYYLKNHAPGRAILADACQLLGLSLWEVRRRLQRREEIDPPRFLADSLVNSVFVRGFGVPGNSRDTP